MNIIRKGYEYELINYLNKDKKTYLKFIEKNTDLILPGSEDGITNEELVKVLLDRIIYLNKLKGDALNREIINHLSSTLNLLRKRQIKKKDKKENYRKENDTRNNQGQ